MKENQPKLPIEIPYNIHNQEIPKVEGSIRKKIMAMLLDARIRGTAVTHEEFLADIPELENVHSSIAVLRLNSNISLLRKSLGKEGEGWGVYNIDKAGRGKTGRFVLATPEEILQIKSSLDIKPSQDKDKLPKRAEKQNPSSDSRKGKNPIRSDKHVRPHAPPPSQTDSVEKPDKPPPLPNKVVLLWEAPKKDERQRIEIEKKQEDFVLDLTDIILSHLARGIIEDLNRDLKAFLSNHLPWKISLSGNLPRKMSLDEMIGNNTPEEFFATELVTTLGKLWSKKPDNSLSVKERNIIKHCQDLGSEDSNKNASDAKRQNVIDSVLGHFYIQLEDEEITA